MPQEQPGLLGCGERGDALRKRSVATINYRHDRADSKVLGADLIMNDRKLLSTAGT